MATTGIQTALNTNENSAKVVSTKKNIKGFVPKRRTLQVVQTNVSSTGIQTSLVSGKGVVRIASEKPFTLSKPATDEPVIKSLKAETRSVEVQTDLTGSSGDLDHAEAIAWMTSLTGDSDQMKRLADEKAATLQLTLEQNEQLRMSNDELAEENGQKRQENDELLKLVAEAKDLFDLVQPLSEPNAESQDNPEVDTNPSEVEDQ